MKISFVSQIFSNTVVASMSVCFIADIIGAKTEDLVHIIKTIIDLLYILMVHLSYP